MIDSEGYRSNVGIILSNTKGKVFWARRRGQSAWQFPQGGIREEESPEQAMYRELREETGLSKEHVNLLGKTGDWMHYKIPNKLMRHNKKPLCIGQKQIWFMLQMIGKDKDFDLCLSAKPEFDHWRWVEYWQPVDEIVAFKRNVYKKALKELEPLRNQLLAQNG